MEQDFHLMTRRSEDKDEVSAKVAADLEADARAKFAKHAAAAEEAAGDDQSKQRKVGLLRALFSRGSSAGRKKGGSGRRSSKGSGRPGRFEESKSSSCDGVAPGDFAASRDDAEDAMGAEDGAGEAIGRRSGHQQAAAEAIVRKAQKDEALRLKKLAKDDARAAAKAETARKTAAKAEAKAEAKAAKAEAKAEKLKRKSSERSILRAANGSRRPSEDWREQHPVSKPSNAREAQEMAMSRINARASRK